MRRHLFLIRLLPLHSLVYVCLLYGDYSGKVANYTCCVCYVNLLKVMMVIWIILASCHISHNWSLTVSIISDFALRLSTLGNINKGTSQRFIVRSKVNYFWESENPNRISVLSLWSFIHFVINEMWWRCWFTV